MVLVEGLTEVRPVNAVPVVMGLLLGPAGAWGCAIGNLIADLFGTFSKASFLGFWGNFIAAYLPYKLWHTLKNGEKPNVKSGLNLFLYLGISALSSLVVAIFLTCGLDVWLKMWLPNLFPIIFYNFYNNLGFPLALGLPILIVLTSDAHNVQPVLPPAKTPGQLTQARLSLAVLVLTGLAITWLLSQGLPMTSFWLTALLGAAFLVSLVTLLLV